MPVLAFGDFSPGQTVWIRSLAEVQASHQDGQCATVFRTSTRNDERFNAAGTQAVILECDSSDNTIQCAGESSGNPPGDWPAPCWFTADCLRDSNPSGAVGELKESKLERKYSLQNDSESVVVGTNEYIAFDQIIKPGEDLKQYTFEMSFSLASLPEKEGKLLSFKDDTAVLSVKEDGTLVVFGTASKTRLYANTEYNLRLTRSSLNTWRCNRLARNVRRARSS